MNKKMNKIFFLTLAFVPFAIAGTNAILSQDSKNVLLQENKENTILKNNINNDPKVDYESFGGHVWGIINSLTIIPVETEDKKGIQIEDHSEIDIPLITGVSSKDYINDLKTISVSIYDVTNNQKIEKVHRKLFTDEPIESENGWWGSSFADMAVVSINFYEAKNTFFDADTYGFQEFHDYQLGFNVNYGDDFQGYSNVISFAKPKIESLKIDKTIDSITVEWVLSDKIAIETNPLIVEYKNITASLNGKSYVIGHSASGSYTFDSLKSATNYNLTLGYEATKTIGSRITTISAQEDLIVATDMPSDFTAIKNTIIFFIILLIILIILLIILFLMFLYSNKQHKKITELALVVDEGNVYENNDYYVDEENYYDDYYEGEN